MECTLVLLHCTGEVDWLLHDLAARAGAASEEHEYGHKQAVWLETAGRFWTIWKPTSDSVQTVSKTVWKNKE
jgi:hypothetical protein